MNTENEIIDEHDISIDENNKTYTSGEVASMIGISRDLVRHYTNEYAEFLNITKTKQNKGGHLRYQIDDINMLKTILQLKKDRTPAEVKALLNDKSAKIIISSENNNNNAALAALLLENNKLLIDLIVEQIQDKLYESQLALVDQRKIEMETLELVHQEMALLREENNQLKNNINMLIDKFDETQTRKGIKGWFKKNKS